MSSKQGAKIEQANLRPYEKYKPAGPEWLSQVPEHWSVGRLKWTITSCLNGIWGDEPDGQNDMPCVRVADFERTARRVDMETPTMRSIKSSAAQGRVLEKGDLLLEKSGGGEKQPVGVVVLYDHDIPAVCSNFVARVPVAAGYDANFLCYLHYWLYSSRVNTRSINQSTGIQNLDAYSYLSEVVASPDLPEQQWIAEFLDRETGKIDALVAKKEELIKLLQEKRRALVETSVSGGSGESIVKLGHYVELLPGFAFPSSDFSHDPDDVRLLRGANIAPGAMRWDDTVYWRRGEVAKYSRYELVCGDIVFGMDRPWIGSGIRVAVVGDNDIPALLLQRVARLRAKGGLSQRYLRLLLSSPQFHGYFEPILTGISVPHVSPDQIRSYRFSLPDSARQDSVCDHYERVSNATDELIDKIERAIEKIQELRTALISAAVTGKIDVREEVA